MKNNISLQGKTALVTGASSGLGREFAYQLAEMGADLIITARSTDKLNELAHKVSEKYNQKRKVRVITADLSKPEAPGYIFEQVKKLDLDVDILVNNAGFGYYGRFDEDNYQHNFNINMVNVVSLSSMCHLFIKPMLDKKEGRIINVASTASFQPVPYEANYAATKAFVLNLSLAMWQEYRDMGITVTALCPGFTATNFAEEASVPETLIKKFTVLEPEQVVREGLEAHFNGEPVIIPKKHRDFLQFTLSKFIPLKMKLSITADMFKPEE